MKSGSHFKFSSFTKRYLTKQYLPHIVLIVAALLISTVWIANYMYKKYSPGSKAAEEAVRQWVVCEQPGNDQSMQSDTEKDQSAIDELKNLNKTDEDSGTREQNQVKGIHSEKAPVIIPSPTPTVVKSGSSVQGTETTNTDCNFYRFWGIQQAINSARNGDVILIKNGRYMTNLAPAPGVVIPNKIVYIEGEDKNNTIIDGSSNTDPVSIFNIIGNSHVSIQNMTILGNPGGVDYQRGILARDNSVLTVTNAVLSHHYFDTIALYNSAHATITKSTLSENNGADSNAVDLLGSSRAKVIGNTINNNDWGIYVRDSSEAIIKNNVFYGNKWSALDLSNDITNNSTVVTNNTIYGNNSLNEDYNQVDIYNKVNVILENNIIDNGYNWGINESDQEDASHSGSLLVKYNNVYNNSDGNYGGKLPDQTGHNGNTGFDPLLRDPAHGNFKLSAGGSPARHSGDPEIHNPDGSRSDMGAYGGPDACTLDPSLLSCSNTSTPAPTQAIIIPHELGCVRSPAYTGDQCNGYRLITSLEHSAACYTLDQCLPNQGNGTCVMSPTYEGDTCGGPEPGYRVMPGIGRACYNQDQCQALITPTPSQAPSPTPVTYRISGRYINIGLSPTPANCANAVGTSVNLNTYQVNLYPVNRSAFTQNYPGQNPGAFLFYGVANGTYSIDGEVPNGLQYVCAYSPTNGSTSGPRPTITVNGANVAGVKYVFKERPPNMTITLTCGPWDGATHSFYPHAYWNPILVAPQALILDETGRQWAWELNVTGPIDGRAMPSGHQIHAHIQIGGQWFDSSTISCTHN